MSVICRFRHSAAVEQPHTKEQSGEPMFALKFKHWGWKGNEVKYIFIISCVPLIAIFRLSAFAIIIAWYVILSVYVNLTSRKTAPDDATKA